MIRAKGWAIGLILGLFACASTSQAALHIDFIDTGTPKNGNVEMTGWHGVIVRLSLDGGLPITRISFGDSVFSGFIYGNIAQRYTDPTEQINYTVTSPGPSLENNTSASDLNFDSHFLGTIDRFTALTGVAEFSDNLYLNRTGLVSTPAVGYGATLSQTYTDPFFYILGGHMSGIFDIRPEFQSSSIDIAYIVCDGPFTAAPVVRSGTQTFNAGASFPEPASLSTTILAAAVSILRRPRRKQARLVSTLEALEPRQLCSVSPATALTGTLLPDGAVHLTWTDSPDETGYIVEHSTDNQSTWNPSHTGTLAADTIAFDDPLLASGQWFRIRSVNTASETANSTAFQFNLPSAAGASDTFALDAQALGSSGLKFTWPQLASGTLGSAILVSRKTRAATTWTSLTSLNKFAVEYTDSTAAVGSAYEYQFSLQSVSGTSQFIYAGNSAATTHSRGTALLIVDETTIDNTGENLQPDIDSYANDLIADGYAVIQRSVPRANMPTHNVDFANGETVTSVFGTWKSAVATTKATIRDV